jgi:hypothetical protein
MRADLTIAQDEHVFNMVIIDGDNMPVSMHGPTISSQVELC